jgi:hypothetical protein
MFAFVGTFYLGILRTHRSCLSGATRRSTLCYLSRARYWNFTRRYMEKTFVDTGVGNDFLPVLDGRDTSKELVGVFRLDGVWLGYLFRLRISKEFA